tara:strand:+ start:251 stop:424 length:174 start_codon:yes stop_codon:yes gene_type:complete
MNIKDYEFVDMSNPEVISENEVAVTLGVKHTPWLALFKSDVIALAKHFKLTPEDLNE